MGLEEDIKQDIIGMGKYVGRLGLEIFLLYGALRIGGIDHEPAHGAVAGYSLLRYGMDVFDGLILKQGRMYDYCFKQLIESRRKSSDRED